RAKPVKTTLTGARKPRRALPTTRFDRRVSRVSACSPGLFALTERPRGGGLPLPPPRSFSPFTHDCHTQTVKCQGVKPENKRSGGTRLPRSSPPPHRQFVALPCAACRRRSGRGLYESSSCVSSNPC